MTQLATPTERLPAERPISDRESEMLARAALEQHWAVSAIPAERRALLLDRVALVTATSAAARAERARLEAGDGFGEPIAESLTMLATAYELAALGQLDAILHEPGAQARRLARDVLALGAARAFRIYQAVRLPEGELELGVRLILRQAALAVVGRQREQFERWAARAAVARRLAEAAGLAHDAGWAPEEPATRVAVWTSWLTLLRRPDREALGRVIDRLGRLREQREMAAAAPADPHEGAHALRLRFQHFALRQAAEAAEQVAAALHRRTVPDVGAHLALHFGAARSAATGDHGLDLLFAWLHGAAVTVAGGVTDQLELPGM